MSDFCITSSFVVCRAVVVGLVLHIPGHGNARELLQPDRMSTSGGAQTGVVPEWTREVPGEVKGCIVPLAEWGYSATHTMLEQAAASVLRDGLIAVVGNSQDRRQVIVSHHYREHVQTRSNEHGVV